MVRCGCGGWKRSGKAICGECWEKSPKALKQRWYNSTGKPQKREALKALIKFAMSRKPNTEQLTLI